MCIYTFLCNNIFLLFLQLVIHYNFKIFVGRHMSHLCKQICNCCFLSSCKYNSEYFDSCATGSEHGADPPLVYLGEITMETISD